MPVLRDVRSLLVITAAIFAATFIGLRATALWSEQRDALRRAEATTRDMALILEEYAKRTFETSDLLLADIARYTLQRGGAEALRGSEEAHRYLVQLSRESSSGDFFLVVDRNGVPTALTAQHPAPNISLKDQRWFQSHLAGGDRIVGEALVGRITGEILFTYTRRLTNEAGEFDGATQVAVRPTFLQEVTRGDPSEAGGGVGREVRLALWSRDGGVVARTGLQPGQIGQRITQSALFTRHVAARFGTFHDVSPVDGTEQIVSFRRLDRWPLIVTASIPRASALALWRQNLAWSVAASVLLLAALGWLVATGTRLNRNEQRAQAALQTVNDQLNETNRRLAKALEDKIALLQEVHHRVKNNLAVTNSLLHLQARRFDDPAVRAAFKDTQDRLRAVALIHEAIYSSDASGDVKLDEYLRRLLNEVASVYGAAERGIAVRVDAEPIEVKLEQAVPLALAVTEAISNAFKHAFTDDLGGSIGVVARTTGGGFEVIVRDTGRGRPVDGRLTERAGSLGTKLIQSFAAQIDGTVTYENDNGTVFRISVPR